jgi:hypothetical protein
MWEMINACICIPWSSKVSAQSPPSPYGWHGPLVMHAEFQIRDEDGIINCKLNDLVSICGVSKGVNDIIHMLRLWNSLQARYSNIQSRQSWIPAICLRICLPNLLLDHLYSIFKIFSPLKFLLYCPRVT